MSAIICDTDLWRWERDADRHETGPLCPDPGCRQPLAPHGDAWVCWEHANHGFPAGCGLIVLNGDLDGSDRGQDTRRAARDAALGRRP